MRELDPRAAWTDVEELLASAVDALNAGLWQRGGGKGVRPKPITRPGVTPITEDPKRARARAAYKRARQKAGG